jgi:hypothetical protein
MSVIPTPATQEPCDASRDESFLSRAVPPGPPDLEHVVRVVRVLADNGVTVMAQA